MISYALIGCGRIAPRHLAAVEANRDAIKLSALCDLGAERALALLPEGSGARVYTDPVQMLLKEKPELVAIATESGSHAGLALSALEAGCHVIVEKPMALSLSDADRMIESAAGRGLLLAVCHQNRFNPAVESLSDLLAAGRFGRLSHAAAQIRWNRGRSYYGQADWRGSWRQDGGALMNQCIHAVDLLRWSLGGRLDELFAYTANQFHPYIEAEDLGAAVIRAKSGALGILEGTVNIYPQNLEETLAVFGEKGTFIAGGKSLNLIEHWQFEDGAGDNPAEGLFEPPDVYGFGHAKLYRDFIGALREGRPPRVGGREGRDALETVLAVYRSAKEHRPVSFPIGDFSTEEMADR